MRIPRRHTAGVLLAVGAGILGLATSAWACTAQVGVAPLPIQAAAPGSEVVVSGNSSTPGNVEIRWNGMRGPVLATALADKGPYGVAFEAPVTIPQVSPGVYYLVVAGGDQGVGRTAVEVTAAPGLASSTAPAAAAAAWDPIPAPPVLAAVESRAPVEVGVALFTVGLITLVAGFGVAGVRRRRVHFQA